MGSTLRPPNRPCAWELDSADAYELD
eukprot:COSAG01_NODE_46735_length_397_cov_1.100671_1_plen_25_part_10